MKHRRLPLVWLALALLACGDDVDDSGAALERQQGEKGWGSSHCPAPIEGVAVGYERFDQIGPLALKTCEGKDVRLADVCGADAAWLFFVHSWCPSCQDVGAMAEGIHDSFAGQNLASLQIVVEDSQGNPPDEEDCQAWREAFGQEDVITLFDPAGASFVAWDVPATSLHLVLDARRVIMSKFHGNRELDIRAAIDARLRGE